MIREMTAVLVAGLVLGCSPQSVPSVCAEGMVERNGVCQPSTGSPNCGANTTLVGSECLPRLEGICAADTRVVASTCVTSLSCGSGTTRLGNECVAPSNPGCGTGTALIGGVCVVNLGSVCSTDTTGAGGNRCVSALSCGNGTSRQGYECVGSTTMAITCGPGTTLQGTVCNVASQTGPLTTFLATTNLSRASHMPFSSGGDRQSRFVASELSQGNADAWANIGSAMIGTGRALHLANFSSVNLSTTPIYFTVEDDTYTQSGIRKCAPGLTPATTGSYSRMAVNFFSWSGGTATALLCGYQGTIRAEKALNPSTGTTQNKLTLNVVFSDGTTLTDHVTWF